MKKIYKKFAVLLFLLVAGSCSLDGDLQNPNEVSVAGADVNLLMNAVQLDFGDWFINAAGTVDPLVRVNAMTGGYRYQTANQPQSMDGIWIQAYQNVLINAETLIPMAKAKNLTTHVAVAELLEAYVWVSMVDIFGDIPQTEALSGVTGNYNPKQDGGASVYQHALDLINDARTNLALTGAAAGAALGRDIFYSGSRANWTAFANTLELKMQMNLATDPAQTGTANARIAVLLNGTASSNIIDTEAENFTYKYGTATVPNSRHPWYNAHYTPTRGAAGGYIANYFMYNAFGIWDPADPFNPTSSNTIQDPRWRYYFNRQVGSIDQMYKVDPKAVGCTPGAAPNHYNAINSVFCIFDPGFYGRDHGDASGTPPSGPVQTCYGVYPAGGKLDDTLLADKAYVGSLIRTDGANGAGISPIWMSFYTDFLRAEFLAKTGNPGPAQTAMLAGISNSVTQIKNFSTSVKQVFDPASTKKVSAPPSTTAYKNAVSALYVAAAKPLTVIGMEFYKALWGNGLEAYNLYRRTSAPVNFQPTLQIGPGPWLRSEVYPSVYVNLNQNAAQKDAATTVRVFWDKNPDVLN